MNGFTLAQKTLLGALVGFARALDPASDDREAPLLVIINMLRMLDSADDAKLTVLAEFVRSAKYTLVPDCAACQTPCGRTDDMTVWQLDEEERSESRGALARALVRRAKAISEPDEKDFTALAGGLFALGYEGYSPEQLLKMSEDL